jgi:hypothetical protein
MEAAVVDLRLSWLGRISMNPDQLLLRDQANKAHVIEVRGLPAASRRHHLERSEAKYSQDA